MLKRRTPLRARAPLRARKPLAPRRLNPRRQGPKAPRIKPKRAEDPERLAKVRRLPCIVCRREGLLQRTPTEAHHLKRKPDGGRWGASQKAPDRFTIPLCFDHHWNGSRQTPPFRPISLAQFEELHGSELELLEETDRLLQNQNL